MIRRNRKAAETLFFRGTRHLESGDVAGAEACFRKALQIAPDFAEAYANLGLLLDSDADAAEICFRRSLELAPSYPETYLNLGALLLKRKRFAEAEAAYIQAIALRPQSPAGWSNLGVLHACMKREVEAEQCYRMAMSLDDSHAAARFNLSYLLLRQGRFEEGWRCLEARTSCAPLAAHLSCPRWHGEPLRGKSILIGYEGGHGDMIQFCRYAAVLKSKGAVSVSMICHPALKTLFAVLESVDDIISFEEPIPPGGWDFWTPLLSIPCYCNTRLDSIPAHIPYLHAPEDRIAKWAPLLPKSGFLVGLAWKGNTQFENDADRSLPSLDVLSPLGAVAGVKFISLQKGAGEDEAMNPPFPMISYRLADFADTAAILTNLDLVICVDTAVAHLAGALGKPCWVLLPEYKTDWRWLTIRADMPWYPGVMRLFRQPATGGWDAVVNDVLAALGPLVAGADKKILRQ